MSFNYYDTDSALESLLDDFDDIAIESEGEVSESVWQKIKNAFETMINTVKGWVSTAAGTVKSFCSKTLGKIKGLFTKAQRDRENAHEYLAEARQEVELCKEELKAAKKSGNKDYIHVSKTNLASAKSDYKNAKSDYKFQTKADKAAHKSKQKMYKEMVKNGWGKSEESYFDYDDYDMSAVDEAFVDYYNAMAIEEDPSIANALESFRTNVDINISSAEECDTLAYRFNDEISQFNRDIQTLKIAAENYCSDYDKDAFRSTTTHALEHLKKSYDDLRLVPAVEGAAFGEDHISQIHNFLVGAQNIISEKASSFYNEEIGNESFLSSLID